jgi:putative multiple sugar transport system ATP-binding protein
MLRKGRELKLPSVERKTTMATPILEMRNITKEFPGVKALKDVSFQVAKGEIHCLVGENGAGKSTLMKVLSGVYPHGKYGGDILLDGAVQNFNGISDSERAGGCDYLSRVGVDS